MKNRFQFLSRFLKSEEAQATTEYMLILSVVATLLIALVNKLIKPAFAKLSDSISNSIQKQLFGMDMHTFRIGR